jgi:hypothetical protein
MCCLLTVLGLLGPRAAIFVWWIVEPARWSHAFHGVYLWPVLGFFLLPWTTLAWVFVAPYGHTSGIGWLFLAIGFLIDLFWWGGGGYGNRQRMRRAPAV